MSKLLGKAAIERPDQAYPMLIRELVPSGVRGFILAALLLSAPVYGLLAWAWPDVAYLHRMVATLGALVLVMAAITAARPLPEPRRLPIREDFDMRSSSLARAGGMAVIAAVLAFFWIFR